MTTLSFRVVSFILLIGATVGQPVSEEYFTNEDYNHNNLSGNANELAEKSLSWLKGAQDMFASPAGHVAIKVAKELWKRSTGNSQVRSEVVLSLNVTNLMIILLLKVLIFTAAFLGAGHFNGYGYGYGYPRAAARSVNGTSFTLSEGEDSLIMAFLGAQGSGIDDCFYYAACANPEVSVRYAKAARALLESIEKFEGRSLSNPRYYDLIGLLEKATYDGFHGKSCKTTTDCSNIF